MSNPSLNINELVDKYSDELYGFAIARVKDSGLAKDLVQETYIKAFEKRDQLQDIQAIQSWLYTVLRNKIIDHYRSLSGKMQKSTIEFDHPDYFSEDERWNLDQTPSDWLASYDKAKEDQFKELSSALAGCMEHLKELPHAVMRLKYLEQVDSKEVCAMLDITDSNYWVIVHRAKLQLRKCMEVFFKKKGGI